jgi:hypothetical protein
MIAACRTAFAALYLFACAAPLVAQGGAGRAWNDSSTLDLVARAIARRSAQLADTGLTDYRAVAHGYLTFFAQIGEGFPDPPQVVRADELAVEVFWRAPNQSKQRVVGRRDTLLLPTDISYHRDHLAIVQNNFPAIIRLGEGDEVRDVPHPLSYAGRDAYDFAVADSLTIRVAGRTWDVVMVDVRPRDDRQARVVGALYLDRETASVVRVHMTFTRAALIDPQLEDVSVVLDNGLVDGRFWLPRRQEIEIRRSGSWLEFPARGIIRGEWDLCCVQANTGLPAALFAGAEIVVAPPQQLRAYPFTGTIADSLAVRIAAAGPGRPGELLQLRAAELVRAGAINRATRTAATGRSVSDFVRVNRVEGLSLGAGFRVGLPFGAQLRARGRYGVADRLAKYRSDLTLGPNSGPGLGRGLTLSIFDEYRDVNDAPEMSGLGNSFAAQEFAADFTDEFRVAGVGASLTLGTSWKVRGRIEKVRETPLAVNASPSRGAYRPAFPASSLAGSRAAFDLTSPLLDGPAGISWRFTAGARRLRTDRDSGTAFTRRRFFDRAGVEALATRDMGTGAMALRVSRAATFASGAPAQEKLHFGGPVSAPGYAARSLVGRDAWSGRLEWRSQVASPAVSLGRFGTTRMPVSLVPFVQGAWLRGVEGSARPVVARSVGLGIETAHDLLRVDVVKGVDRQGGWALYVDFGRAFWPIL